MAYAKKTKEKKGFYQWGLNRAFSLTKHGGCLVTYFVAKVFYNCADKLNIYCVHSIVKSSQSNMSDYIWYENGKSIGRGIEQIIQANKASIVYVYFLVDELANAWGSRFTLTHNILQY